MKAYLYKLNRFIVSLIARPKLTGEDNLPTTDGVEVVYVLHHRSLTDLIVLDMVCAANDKVSPLKSLQLTELHEPRRFFSLYRSAGGRMTMQKSSERMRRLVESPVAARQTIQLVPVSVFWGRSTSGEGSIFRQLTSEHWSVTGRFKRIANLLINRRNISVHTGRPIPLLEVAPADVDAAISVRRTARFLRVRLRQQKITALGPDFSHRRTLLAQVFKSRAVQDAIDRAADKGERQGKVERRAMKYARTIASDMSNPTIRVLARLLRWFWHKIYDGIEVRGLERLEATSGTHTLVYVPSHRSHLDYLLLSYLLYDKGYMIPHIAAGDNLNLPLVGSILRRGGAFFMRRSFRGDALYTAVFDEYLFQVYQHGHCVEFFPEGGRTRTGRLLPPKLGLLKMSIEHQQRGLPRPLAFVPVYFGYEKLVEGSSYLSELRGAGKKKESVMDVIRNLRLIRQNFGSVEVNVGPPIHLDDWLKENAGLNDSEITRHLGEEILQAVNAQASINPVNLIALVTLTMPKLAIEESALKDQIACYQVLLQHLWADSGVTVTPNSPEEIIQHVEELGLLKREEESFGDVLIHEPFAAVLMTWYRNNVVHTLALPSLVACLTVRRRLPVSHDALEQMVRRVYPYLCKELTGIDGPEDLERCLAAMIKLGLLLESDNQYTSPSPSDPNYQRLNMLAQLVTQTLERMYIVIQQLTFGSSTRDELRAASQAVAKRMSRIYGINAPEFSDQRLFDVFIDRMIKQGVVHVNDEGTLEYDDVINQVVRAAEYVIEPQIRQGVLSATHQV